MSAAWRVDDFNSDMHRLNALMDVICSLQFDRLATEVVPHVDELLWIAREMTEGLTSYAEENYARMKESGQDG